MNETDAIAKELSRVRALKRNAESSVEFLRSEMESGRLHLRVSSEVKGMLPYLDNNSCVTRYSRFDYIDPVTGETSTVKKSWRFLLFSELFTSEGDIKDEVVIEL